MKKTLSTMAAAAILMTSTAIAPAFAQTAQPAPAAPASPSAPADTMTTAPAVGSTAAVGAYLTEQSESQISANEYIGKSVYNAENSSIGNINDLILEENGGIVAAVVGVGGFLGIGQKDVAVPLEKVTLTRDAANNNEVRLTTTETAESLQAAPEFMTLSDQQSAADQTTTSSTATPAAPAPAGGATTPSTTKP